MPAHLAKEPLADSRSATELDGEIFVFYSLFGCSRFCSGRASKDHHASTEFNKTAATGATAIT